MRGAAPTGIGEIDPIVDGVIYRIDPLTGLIDAFYDPVNPANPLGTTNPAMT